MVSFAHPWLLVCLAFPIALAIGVWKRRGHHVVVPFDFAHPASGRRLKLLVNLAELCPSLLAAVAVLLLAVPQKSLEGELVHESRNIWLLVDASGSMKTAYGKTTRFNAAINAIDKFSHYRRGDTFALSFFGNDVIDWLPASKDVSGIRLASQFVNPAKLPPQMSGTMIGNALGHIRQKIRQSEGEHIVVLVTDGQSEDLGGAKTSALCRQLINDKIKVFSIFIGDPRTDSTTDMKMVSDQSGGRMFSADDPKSLAETFKQIDLMVPAKFKRTERTSVDAFGPLIVAGLVLLGIQLFAGFGLRYTPW